MFPLILAGGAALAAFFLSGCDSPKVDCPQGTKLDTPEKPLPGVQFTLGKPSIDELKRFQSLVRTASPSTSLQDPAIRKAILPLFQDSEENRRALESLATAMKLPENTGKNFEIAVHTSSDGSAKINTLLSQRRAEALRSLFVYLGVPENRLSPRGYGKGCLLLPEQGEPAQIQKAQDANRRVEIFLR